MRSAFSTNQVLQNRIGPIYIQRPVTDVPAERGPARKSRMVPLNFTKLSGGTVLTIAALLSA